MGNNRHLLQLIVVKFRVIAIITNINDVAIKDLLQGHPGIVIQFKRRDNGEFELTEPVNYKPLTTKFHIDFSNRRLVFI